MKHIYKYLKLLIIIIFLTACNNEELINNQQTTINNVTEDGIVQNQVLNKIPATNTNSLTLTMDNPQTLHPLYNMNESVDQILRLMFNTLVNIEPDGSVTPNLANYWAFNEAENSMIITLNTDIKWHDGTNLHADDVAYSIQVIQQASESIYKICVSNISRVTVLSPESLQIYYKQSFSGTYQTMFFPVIPQHIYDVGYAQAYQTLPVGSGPYKYASATTAKNLTLEANTSYFKGRPNIEMIDILFTPDHSAALSAFEQGLVDIVYTEVMDWGKYAKDKSTTIYEVPTQNYEFIGVNAKHSILGNANIREALVYGLDRTALVEMHYLGRATITDTPISPNSYLYSSGLEIRSLDREKLRLILAQEGYNFDEDNKVFMKDGEALSFKFLINGGNAERVEVAYDIMEKYREVGIILVPDVVDATTYVSRVQAGNFDLFLGGWKLSYIPDLTFAFHSSQTKSNNFIGYSNADMDWLLEANYKSHPVNITYVYKDFQDFFLTENPYISLYFKNGALLTNTQISDNVDPDPLNVYSNIHEWEIILSK